MQDKLAILVLLIILLGINGAIAKKEKHLAEGIIVYLELAPVDPRSLMQGDYMALRFRMANEIQQALTRTRNRDEWQGLLTADDGYAVVRLNERNIGTFQHLQQDETSVLADNEILMRYRVRNGMIKFATNAFFFQEGHAQRYEQARYGQFRVDAHGELLLADMVDEDLNTLQRDMK